MDFHTLVKKYDIKFTGILHVGAHVCEEIYRYEHYLTRDKILWVEAIPEKVEHVKNIYPGILIEQAVISDKVEQVKFNITNNAQSSSILNLGLHKTYYPHIEYIDSFQTMSTTLDLILDKHPNINVNFLNLDLQGVELRALVGLGDYLKNIDYLITEVNDDYVYEGCCLVTELDEFLKAYDLYRVETEMTEHHWGDSFYIKQKKT